VVRTRRVDLRRWLPPATRASSSAGDGAPAGVCLPPAGLPLVGPPVVATFVDTPGQEIFHRLRLNGALAADVVVSWLFKAQLFFFVTIKKTLAHFLRSVHA
jgi:hypothetical protein